MGTLDGYGNSGGYSGGGQCVPGSVSLPPDTMAGFPSQMWTNPCCICVSALTSLNSSATTEGHASSAI